MNMRNGQKQWQDLQIQDDFMFAKVMREKELCIRLLEKLLHTKIKDIQYLEEQKTIDVKADAKSVRLDVYVEDERHVFNLEMQTTNQKNLPKRTRYYQALIDLNKLEKGENYKKLKDSIIIFICTFDAFDQNLPRYTFENYCREKKELPLNDGTTKVFFNTTAYEKEQDEDVKAFLQYVNGETNDNPLVVEMQKTVEKAKSNEEWRLEYMTLSMLELDAKQEGFEEGIEQGLEQGITVIIKRFRKLGFSDTEIKTQLMEDFDLSKDEAQKYLE